MRAAALTIFAIVGLTGCQQTAAVVQPAPAATRMKNEREEERARDLESKAFADAKISEAKGTRTCLIKQSTSAHRAKEMWASGLDTLYSYSSKSSDIHFRIERGGGVGVAVGDDTYPGMKSFFLIGDGRYSADGRYYADVTPALALLRKDAMIKYAWHKWPYRTEINNSDVFAGFAPAYDQCLKFLRGGPIPE